MKNVVNWLNNSVNCLKIVNWLKIIVNWLNIVVNWLKNILNYLKNNWLNIIVKHICNYYRDAAGFSNPGGLAVMWWA